MQQEKLHLKPVTFLIKQNALWMSAKMHGQHFRSVARKDSCLGRARG